MKNPYIIHPAEMKDFVGRKTHYRKLHQLLKGTPSIILVIGIRGMGKASFLKNILHQDFEPQPLFIEYNSKKHEREFVIPDLYRNRKEIPEHSELVKKLNTLKLKFTFSDYSPSSQKEPLSEDFFKAADIFRLNYESLMDIQNTLKKIKANIVVLVNVHNLLPAEQWILEELVKNSQNFFLIIKLTEEMASTMVISNYEPIELEPLSREESVEIIGKGKFLDEETSEAVYELSGGYPYLVQVISWILYEKHLRGEDIHAFIDMLREEEPEDFFGNVHQEILTVLNPDARRLLIDLSCAPSVLTLKVLKAFSQADPHEGLSDLIEKGILSQENGIFRVHLALSPVFLEYIDEDEIIGDFTDIYLEAARTLKKDDDCVFLLEDLRNTDEGQSEVIPVLENEEVLLGFGTDELYAGRLASAERCFERGLQLNGALKSAFLARLGIVFQRVEIPDKALQCYEQALHIHKETGYNQGEADQLGNIGWIYKEKGSLDEAETHYKRALEIDRELKDKQREALHLGEISAVYREKGEPDKALTCSTQALEIERELQHAARETIHLKDIGAASIQMGNLDEGLTYLKQALERFTSSGDRYEVLSTYAHIFDGFIRKDDPVTAFSYMKKALEYTQDEEYTGGIFAIMMMTAKHLMQENQWKYLQHITLVKSPHFGKELNSLVTAVGYYAKYKLSGNKVYLKDYKRRKKKLGYSARSILDELFKRK